MKKKKQLGGDGSMEEDEEERESTQEVINGDLIQHTPQSMRVRVKNERVT